MDVDTRGRLLGLLCDWMLPIVVVFCLEVVGYFLYTRYLGQQTQVPAARDNAPSRPSKSKADSWPRNLRLRSECSTDLSSDADYLSSRQGSGELGGQDVLTHRSCSIPSRVAGLALDGVVLRRSTAPPTTNRHGLPSDLSGCSPPRTYSPSVSEENGNAAITYAPKDLLDILGCMRKGGYLDGKTSASKDYHCAPLESHGSGSQGSIARDSDIGDPTSLSSCKWSQRLHSDQVHQNRPRAAPWDSAATNSNPETPKPSAVERNPNDPDLQKREEAANLEARPLLYKALKFRQFDIASTIYLGFKHERMTIRPETFVLLIQVALSSKAFATCAEWLVELMKQSDVDAEWLDRVLAAISVGAPLVLKALIDELEELRSTGRLSSACSSCVAHATSYLAIASSQASVSHPGDSSFRADVQRLVRSPPGLSFRTNKLNPTSPQSKSRGLLKPYTESPPSSRGLNPNAPEFVPAGPVLAEPAQDELQQTVLAHQQLQQNILMLLQQQQKPSDDLPRPVTDISPLPLQQSVPPLPEATLEVLQTNHEVQNQETLNGDEGASEEQDPTAEVQRTCAQEVRPSKPAEGSVAVAQPEKPQDNSKEGPRQQQQESKTQPTLQQQLQQHLERALLQHRAPPGLPPRRHLRNLRQQGVPATLQGESCSSPAESKEDDAASRQRIADALISCIASHSKTT